MYIVITGTSRGIGLELTRKALEKGHHVLAVARSPEESSELMQLKSDKLIFAKVELSDNDAHSKIAEATKNWPMVDIVINNAGIYEEDKTLQNFEKSFLINSIKPLFITQALKEKLKKSKHPVAVFITSQMGSIEDNTSGGSYSYRASKTALNMLIKSLSIDENWLISLLVHPGWVQTRMGGDNAPTTPTESADGIWKLIESAKTSDNGSYRDFRGKILPW